jgi:hypothetical protein
MSAALLSNVVAVVGTLSGGLVTGLVQARVARVTRRETRSESRWAEALAAVTALVSALADHRRAMWVREDLRLAGADTRAIATARSASHVTRSAITGPLVTVRILAPVLDRSAKQAVEATYALRNAPDQATLAALRSHALSTANQLIESASQVFSAELAQGGEQR